MEILSGLFDHMVLQRNSRGRSEAAIAGTVSDGGEVLVRASRKGRLLPGWDARRIGRARHGRFRATVEGLPTGGPYTLDLQVQRRDKVVDRLTVRDVLVGDVWLVGGQSNMQGCGLIGHAPARKPMVRACTMDDRWDVAKDPIHNMWACVDPVHIDLCGGVRPAVNTTHGLGPAVAFGQELFRRTGVPQGLLACAHGGTSMTQWDPARKAEGGRSLYGAMIRRLEKNGGKAAGLIWYQGESDASAEAAALYTGRMKQFIRALRRDARHPGLPVAIVQLSRFIGAWIAAPFWNSIQEQQRQLGDEVKNLAVVPAIDLTLEDTIHVGGKDMNRLGVRLAQAMHAMAGGAGAGRLPIRLKRVTTELSKPQGLVCLVVEFDRVHGRLVSGGRPVGFEVLDASGQPCLFDVRLDGRRAILRTTFGPGQASDHSLWYGHGLNPVCNITDEGDRALPVFGPIPSTGQRRAMTPFVQTLRVTEPLVGAGDLTGLAYPGNLASLPWRKMEFPARFCDLHLELGKLAPQDLLVYFACRIDVSEKMRLAACVGYDGPVKVWVDGREIFWDPKGVNPAWEDKGRATFDAEPGQHQVLIGLGTNQCKAWGIFLRFERLRIPPSLLARGPEHYAMPIVVPE
ncbi:MAG: hypothetical protein HYU36_14200 [Planctomycetes bacterium]|nr:hypothetical protein [Planctomycetota bacterium]